jgi:hypothetical protein
VAKEQDSQASDVLSNLHLCIGSRLLERRDSSNFWVLLRT